MHKKCNLKDSLYAKHKEMVDECWDFEKNDVNPWEIYPHSSYNAWWKCKSCDNSYQMKVSYRVGRKYCPRCVKYLKTSFREQAVYFYIRQVFPDAENNYSECFSNNMEVDIYVPSLKTAIEYDGYKWHLNSKERDERKNRICFEKGIHIIRIRECMEGKKLPEIHDNSVIYNVDYRDKDAFEEILREIIRNLADIDADIDIDRDLQLILKNRLGPSLENSLAKTHPELMDEWSDKNIISPYTIPAQFNGKVIWKCKRCGHEWEISPNKRLSMNRGCPRCSNQAIEAGVNDLATKRPEIIPFWNDEEIKPTEISEKSGKKVHLKCPICHTEWVEQVSYIFSRKHICQYCNIGKKTHRTNGKPTRQTPVKAINVKTGEIKEFVSGAEAARELGLDHSSVFKVLRGTQKTSKGYRFEHI